MKSIWKREGYLYLFVCLFLSLLFLFVKYILLFNYFNSSSLTFTSLMTMFKSATSWRHEGWYGAMIPHPMPMTAGCHSTQQRIAMQCNYLKSVECGDSAGWPQNAPWTTQTSGLEFVFTVISRIIFKLWTWFNLHNISTESRWIYYLFAPPFWRGAANIDTNNRSLNREKDQDNEITFLKLVWISQSQC